jgi:anti-anti-sigma regulatory factor
VRDDVDMKNAVTVILTVGDFTSALACKVSDLLGAAAARGRRIVISLECTARWSWDALCQLAALLRGRHRNARVSFSHVPPSRRALLREVGLDGTWIVEAPPPIAAQRVRISA